MSADWYVVSDIDGFVDKTRALVFNSFGKQQNDQLIGIDLDVVAENEKDEFDKVLSHDESMIIAKDILRKQTNKINMNVRYLVSDKIYSKLVSSLNERMIGNILNNLVNKGLVEAAFDSDSNDFVFWVKDDEENQNPETD